MDAYRLPRNYDKPFDRKDKIFSSFVSDLPQIEEAVDPEQLYTGCSEDEPTIQHTTEESTLASRIAQILMIKEKPLKLCFDNALPTSKSSNRSKPLSTKHSNSKESVIGPKTFFSPKYSLCSKKNDHNLKRNSLQTSLKPSYKSSQPSSQRGLIPYSPSNKLLSNLSSYRNGDSMCLTLADLTTSTSSRLNSIYSSPRLNTGNGSISGRTQFNATPRKNNYTVSLPQTPELGKFNKLLKGLFDNGQSQTNLHSSNNGKLKRDETAPVFLKYKSKSIISATSSPQLRNNYGRTSPLNYTPMASPQKKQSKSIVDGNQNKYYLNMSKQSSSRSRYGWRTSLASYSQIDLERYSPHPQPHPEYKSSRSARNKSLDNNFNYHQRNTPSPSLPLETEKKQLNILIDNFQNEIQQTKAKAPDPDDNKRIIAQLDMTLRRISGLLEEPPIKPTHAYSKSVSSGVKAVKHISFCLPGEEKNVKEVDSINQKAKINELIDKRVEELDTQIPNLGGQGTENFVQSIDEIRDKLVEMLNMLN